MLTKPMKSLWSDHAADSFVARYAAEGIGPNLALRVYSAHL
ncbi:hypothetical protein CCP3SC1_380001 [Gammaproteobacteria bacterium]